MRSLHKKTLSCRIGATALALLGVMGAAWAEPPVSFDSLLHEMTDPTAVAKLDRPAFITSQASSYDRASKNPADANGWFANHDWNQLLGSNEH